MLIYSCVDLLHTDRIIIGSGRMIIRVQRMCLEHSRTVLVSLLLSLVGETLAVETGGINLGSGSSYGEI